MKKPIRFYLDADVSPKVAVIGRGLGLDVVSAHEVGMTEAADADQMARAAAEGRVLVTRNRDDFLALTLAAYHDRAPHRGLLVVRELSPSHRASRLAHALRRWATARTTVASYGVYWLPG